MPKTDQDALSFKYPLPSGKLTVIQNGHQVDQDRIFLLMEYRFNKEGPSFEDKVTVTRCNCCMKHVGLNIQGDTIRVFTDKNGAFARRWEQFSALCAEASAKSSKRAEKQSESKLLKWFGSSDDILPLSSVEIDETPCALGNIHERTCLTSEIEVPTGELVFFDRHPRKLTEDRHEPDFDINRIGGRNELMQWLAERNIGYGQTGNMGVQLYTTADKSEVVIGSHIDDPASYEREDFDTDDEYKAALTSIEDARKMFSALNGAGGIDCEVWRWMCVDRSFLTDADMTTLEKKHRGNFCLVSVTPGRYRIEHYMDHARMQDDYDEYAPLVISKIIKLA